MSQINYITDILNIKDKNIFFKENFYSEEKIKGITHKIFEGYLSYKPKCCPKCGCIFNEKQTFEKHGFITSDIKIQSVVGFNSILRLHKQRIKCHSCNKPFTLFTPIVNKGCFISNNTKLSIVRDLVKKRSEKDIAIDNNVSPNTVERVIDSYYKSIKLYKHYLPKVLSFDEFKSVKSADGAMSFHICNGETGQTIDIVEDRKLMNLLKYFSYYTHKARANVKLIVIDMYSPYISLIQKMFPNAQIIIDKFHLIQLISRSLNKTRIMIMKKDKTNYNKFKRYWKLILKSRDELNCSKWKKFRCFDNLMTDVDVVNYLVNSNNELKDTYQAYQDLLYALQHNDITVFKSALNNTYNNLSSYMKTSIKTLKSFTQYIENTFKHKYHNGFIEGNNNFIKVIKRIAFGFRNFSRFKARIMICKGLIVPKRANA